MRILYLTYNGLTSLIGQSQVWPYLQGLAAAGHRFDIISFEHADRFQQIGEKVASEAAASGIAWHPCRFRARPPFLSKLLDQRELKSLAGRIAGAHRFDAVHARSYVAADAALTLKRRFGLPFVFDMRGFWVDQRREGNRWRTSNPFYRALYRHWKAKEAALIANADQIIVLSEAAREVVENWDCYRGQPVAVIPCCIDHQDFAVRTPEARAAARAQLDIPDETTVLAYLGSLGTVYLLRDMLRFFSRLRSARPGAKFLFIGRHSADNLRAEARSAGIEIGEDEIRVQFAEHDRVSFWLAAADLAICLITPTFSSRGVSPTKLGEYLACGLPVVVNEGIGDVTAIVRELDAGAVLSGFSEDEMGGVVDRLDRLLAIDAADLSARSRQIHDMPVALAKYGQVYDIIATKIRERSA